MKNPKYKQIKFETKFKPIYRGHIKYIYNQLKRLKAIEYKTSKERIDIVKLRRELRNIKSFDKLVIHKKTNERIAVTDWSPFCIDRVFRVIHTRRKNKRRKVAKSLFGHQMIGGTFVKDKSILSISNDPRRNDPKEEKTPLISKINYIGIELEFRTIDEDGEDSERHTLNNLFTENGLAKYVNVTSDPSCGHEVRVLLPEKNYKTPLKKILKIIRNEGFHVDNSCGTHVHLDMRNRDVKKCYHNLFKMQSLMYKLVPKDRRENNYCKPNEHSEYDEAASNVVRYSCINVGSYSKHSTLEIRLHHGSLSYSALSNWIDLLLLTINCDRMFRKKISTLEDLKKRLKIKSDKIKSLKKRYALYNAS